MSSDMFLFDFTNRTVERNLNSKIEIIKTATNNFKDILTIDTIKENYPTLNHGKNGVGNRLVSVGINKKL